MRTIRLAARTSRSHPTPRFALTPPHPVAPSTYMLATLAKPARFIWSFLTKPIAPDLCSLRFDPTSPGRMSAVLCYDHARSAVSSNGRTLDSESSSWGSNPCTAATPLPLRTAWLGLTFDSA